MSNRFRSAKAALLLLGLAFASTFPLRVAHAGVKKSQAPAYVAPLGNEDLTVQILRADGNSLRETATIRLARGQVVVSELLAGPRQRHRLLFSKVPLGPLRLQIIANGFATADLKLLLDHPDREMRVTVYLRPETRPGPGGESWIPILSAAASSHYADAVDSLRRGDLQESLQYFGKLRRAEFGHPNVQYFAGVMAYRSRDTGMAVFHFSQAAYLNPQNEDSARALAGLLYRSGIYGEAYEEFSRLARKHPQDWQLAWAAASAALLSARYSEAREAAATVATQAKDPDLTGVAKILLAAVGPEDATGASDPQTFAPEQAEAGLFSADDFDPRVPSRLWAPPDVDGAMPAMVRGTSCNAAEVLSLAGRRVLSRFEELSDVGAKDHIEQAVLDAAGKVVPVGHFTADYLPEAILLPNGTYAVDEFLAGAIPEPSPASSVAQGRAGLALIFEPAMQPDFTFECEGLTQWKDRPAWSVYFTQRKDRPARLHAHNNSGRIYPAYIRGRGFVDQASGELLHIETDLVNPIPELRLEEEHLVVEYMPVTFENVAVPFYLPSEAQLYVHIRGHLYRIREDFKDYVRFAVATHQEIKGPREQAQEKEPEP